MSATVTGRVVVDLSSWRQADGLPELRRRLEVLARCPADCPVVVVVAEVVPPLDEPIAWPPIRLPAGLQFDVHGSDPATVRAVVLRLRFALDHVVNYFCEGTAA